MNHQHAAELVDADGNPKGIWHYVESNRREGTHAIGYCSPWEACPNCAGRSALGDPRYSCERCDSKGIVPAADPCPGHATPEEAAEHYRQYLLNERLRLDIALSTDVQMRCNADGCEAWTQHAAGLGPYSTWPLCDEHRTRETVDALFPSVGESWGS